MHCAIYPRKSKAVDNSDSMDVQVDMCIRYLNDKFGSDGYTYTVYDKDYGITGHSTKKRKDFLRMMDDVRSGKIQLVVIQRYDRIARNTRDFCNLYHDMEQAGCNLVSVSQQIDTTTPYGKNFMYMQASMAELEWALNSERRKDAIKYATSIGKLTLADHCCPRGYKPGKVDGIRRLVKNPDMEEYVMHVFNDFAQYHNVARLVKYSQDIGISTTPYSMRQMIKNTVYYGEYKGNLNFCEPYISKELWGKCQKKQSVVRQSGKKTEHLFVGMIKCPVCNRRMRSQTKTKGETRTGYYICEFVHQHKCTWNKVRSERMIESELIAMVDKSLAEYEISAEASTNTKKKTADKSSQIQKEIDRLNTMFQKGRISEEKYDAEYLRLENELALEKAQNDSQGISEATINAFNGNWQDIYFQLDALHKKLFWRQTIKQIILDEETKAVKAIIFL